MQVLEQSMSLTWSIFPLSGTIGVCGQFVRPHRLKNSWGAWWVDGGSCGISANSLGTHMWKSEARLNCFISDCCPRELSENF